MAGVELLNVVGTYQPEPIKSPDDERQWGVKGFYFCCR